MVWSQATPNEMIMSFLFVYPRPLRVGAVNHTDTINCCGLQILDEAGTPGTMCTNGNMRTPGVSILPVNPLSENGLVGWSPAFGGTYTCAAGGGGSGGGSTAAGESPAAAPSLTPGGQGAANGDGGVCFPATSTATVAGRGHVAMADLRLGDAVRSADGSYSRIYLWSHADAAAVAPFVAITTAAADDAAAANGTAGTASHTHTISAGHLLPTAGVRPPLPASAITPGVHSLVDADGRGRPVSAVRAMTAAGLYHPHTLAGNLLVDGAIVATDRTTAVPAAGAAAGLATARVALAVGLGGVLSGVLAEGCPRPQRTVLPLLRGLRGLGGAAGGGEEGDADLNGVR